jgi:hypothetical protein
MNSGAASNNNPHSHLSITIIPLACIAHPRNASRARETAETLTDIDARVDQARIAIA